MRHHLDLGYLTLGILLVGGTASLPAGMAAAAPTDETGSEYRGKADLQAVVEDLQKDNPGLTKEEALDLAQTAMGDVESRGSAERAGVTGENAGIITQGPTHLGAPELGGSTGGQADMTPEQRELAGKVENFVEKLRREGRSEMDIPAALREEFGKELNGPLGGMERSDRGHNDDGSVLLERGDTQQEVGDGKPTREHEKPTREQVERYRELEKEYKEYNREHGELPAVEHERPAAERPLMERERERPSVERSSVETPTRETQERPSTERPTETRSPGSY